MLFKESMIVLRTCGEDETRMRYSIVLDLPVITTYPIPLREKFLSNLVAPILYYFATVAAPTTINTPKISTSDPSLPEMTTIESMSSLLLNAITLSKTKQKQVTTLVSLPEPILLKILSNVDIQSIKNIQLLCKPLYSLVNGSLSGTIWKGIQRSTCYYNGKKQGIH